MNDLLLKVPAAIIPIFLLAVPLYGYLRGVDIYAAFIEGAKRGIQTITSVLPYLAAMMIALSVFRASGALEAVLSLIRAPLAALGFPAEALPLAVMRPLSGSGSIAMLSELFGASGVDSRAGRVAACIVGGGETFVYTLSLYCGHSGLRKTRYVLPTCLIASVVGAMVAAWVCP